VTRKLLVLGAALAMGATPALAAQRWLTAADRGFVTDGAVQSVALPHADSGPTTLTISADGQVWFTESSGNRIGRMNPDGTDLTEFALPHPGSSPRILALGADGNLWFSEHTGNRMGRITPAGVITEFDIPTPDSHPRAIALGADGAIWFGEFDGGKIGRISTDGRISEFVIPTPNSGPRALAAGTDGSIWFSEYRASKIGRITPAGVITEYPLPRANAGPGDITAGADGALWFVELSGGMDGLVTDGNRVGRITTAGVITEFAMPTASPSAVNLAVGPDRNVWYTQGARLGRVTPDGRITEFPLGENARGVGLSAGSDRQPPATLTNRLYVADGGKNRIAWLEFAPATARPAGSPLAVISPVMGCEAFALTALTLDDGTPVRIETAVRTQNDGHDFCTLKGYAAPQVRFELRLPVDSWHQRLLFTGCGGFCGQVAIRAPAAEHCSATDNGEMALVSSDLGHAAGGNDTLWAAGNPQGLADYGHRAVHVVTQAAKRIAARYYGQAPRYSYFSGCSDGGREAVVAALRYPKDFDGIVAGAPVVDVATNNSLYHAWLVRQLSRRDGSLRFTDADLHRLYEAQRKACPLTPGGVVADPRACRVDLATLNLTDEQLAAAKALYSGPVDEQGKPLYFGAPPGSELTWNAQVPGSRLFATSFISYVASDPPLKDFDLWSIDFTRARHQAYTRVNAVIGAVDPDLRSFQKAGGKLLLWHGWGDAGVPAGGTVHLYEGLQRRLGHAAAAKMLRLYMLPGVYHCGNGPGPDRVDLLTPVMDWVERGIPPGAVSASSRSGAAPAVVLPEP
jgi:streptogramin lyase